MKKNGSAGWRGMSVKDREVEDVDFECFRMKVHVQAHLVVRGLQV